MPMYEVLLGLHVIVCVLVILVVLIQTGKGAGLSNVFGGGGGDAVFSAPSGSSFMRKLTTGFAVAFFMTCILLTYLTARQGSRTVTRNAFQGSVPMDLPASPEAPQAPLAEPAPAAPSPDKK
jgi:preprotein translocase subunit SecG